MQNTTHIMMVAPANRTLSRDELVKLGNSMTNPTKIYAIVSIQELLPAIGNLFMRLNVLVIDAELLVEMATNVNKDIIAVLTMLLTCANNCQTCTDKCSGPDTVHPPLTKIAIAACSTSSHTIIKQALKIAGVCGVFPYGPTISPQLQHQALTDITTTVDYVDKQTIATITENCGAVTRTKTSKLSKRQQQIFDLIVRKGASNKVIATSLGITDSTVKLHVTAILDKFGCKSRAQLIAFSTNTPRALYVVGTDNRKSSRRSSDI